MKLNRLFLLAAMGLGLFACNDNDLVEGSASNGTQEEGTTYVGFSLKFSNTNTRAEGDLATEEESHITSAYVMMASDDGATFAKVLSMSDTPTGEDVEGYYTTEGKFLFQTTAGNHDFYAVINPDEAPKAGGVISDYFNKAISLDITKIANTNGQGNFMMSNCSKNTFNLVDNVAKEQALNGNKDEDATNNFTISVERVVAKVTMTCLDPKLESESGATNVGGTIDNLQFYLMGEATKSYRMAYQNLNLTRDDGGISDSYTIMNGSINENGIIISTGAVNDKTKATPVYCLENLQDSYVQGNTTYILLKTDFIPTKIVDCTNADGTTTDNDNTSGSAESFYVVRSGDLAGNYIIKADLDNYMKDNSNNYPQGVLSISEEYVNGTCWFGPIWVGQENANDNKGPVKRNTWYNLNISKIKLPGDPKAPEINNPQPLVPNTNVAITLDVMDWVSADREITLQ